MVMKTGIKDGAEVRKCTSLLLGKILNDGNSIDDPKIWRHESTK